MRRDAPVGASGRERRVWPLRTLAKSLATPKSDATEMILGGVAARPRWQPFVPSLPAQLEVQLVPECTAGSTARPRLPRAATADVEIGGQLIKAGEGVLVMLNSGNRDESAFEKADSFDIRRQCPSHLGFGHGLHKCIGAAFARLELSIAFGTLFRRIPDLRLATDIDSLAFRHEMVLYGLKGMPVTWSTAR